MSHTEYYDILGISKTATDEEIKKAYKKMVKIHHPDRHQDSQEKEKHTKKYKDISEAFEILYNPEKRKKYDIGGKDALKGTPQTDPNDIFSQFFGSSFFGGNLFGNRTRQTKIKPLEFPYHISLRHLYKGKKVKLSVERNIIVDSQNREIDPTLCPSLIDLHKKCSQCQGRGSYSRTRSIAPGFIAQENVPCPPCNGSGNVIKDGYKHRLNKEIVEFDIPPGMPHKSFITFKHKGHMVPGFEVADLHVYILESVEAGYRREENDLYVNLKIDLGQALLGNYIIYEHLDETKYRLKSNQVIKPGTMKKIPKMGFASVSNPNIKGNLYLIFEIVFPDQISSSDISLLNQIWPNKVNHTFPILELK
jgi:DnaJ family protein A protein 2